MSLPFIGPSYNLRSRTADLQRTIGMYPLPIEPGNTRTPWRFKDVPGKTVFATVASGSAARGGKNADGRGFVVFGNGFYEMAADGTATLRGSLSSSFGLVGMTYNTTQFVVSDAINLYILTLATNAFQVVPYPGEGRIEYLNQYMLFRYRDSQQFGWTALGDATSIDALDFASAEGSPDKLVGLFVDHREVLLFGSNGVEDWINTGSESVFERNNGTSLEDGCASEWTIQKLDGSVYWLSASERGQGAVNRLQGYQPIRVSDAAIEERLSGLDLTGAYAYTYESEKSSFYCLQVPGLDTTLVFDAFTQKWHERAKLVDGQRQRDRGKFHVYLFGRHLLGDDDGVLYEMDPEIHNDAGLPLLRERVSADSATPNRKRLPYGRFTLDCDRGAGGKVELRYSNDGGANWGDWKNRSLGELGVFGNSVKWDRTGSGKDRVTHLRCTDDVPFNPVAGGYD